jgi:hypothetical protein
VESGQRVYAGIDLAELRHSLCRQDEAIGGQQVLATGAGSVLPGQLARNNAPDFILLRRVLDVGDGLAGAMGRTDGCDVAPPGSIHRVGESGVVGGQLERRQHLAKFLPRSRRYI